MLDWLTEDQRALRDMAATFARKEVEPIANQIDLDEHTPDDRLDRQFLGAVTESGFVMAHRVLRSFFDAQLVVAERLVARTTVG